MAEPADSVQTLLTSLIDSRNGYDEALADAEGKGLTGLFQEMIALRRADESELTAHLASIGMAPDTSASFMSTVHRTVISVRSVVTGLDENILPSLISGEERILELYDDALAAEGLDPATAEVLRRQRETLARKISAMRGMERGA